MKMLYLYLELLLIIFCRVSKISCTIAISEPEDNCMISVVIPKESIKATCNGGNSYHTEQKLKSVESQLSTIRKDMNSLNIRLTYTINNKGKDRDTQDIASRLSQLESVVKDIQANFTKDLEQDTDKEVNGGLFNRKKIVRLIRTVLRKELSGMRDNIHQQLKDDIRSEILSYLVKDNKSGYNINSKILFNTATTDNHQNEQGYSYGPNTQTKQELDTQKRLEEKLKNEYDAIESTLNNEVPEYPQSRILQSDDQTKAGDFKEAIVILTSEVKKHLNKQTQKVKDIVGQHLNVTESKIHKVSENLTKKYDTFVSESIRKGYNDISDRIEQIEHDIETLGTGLSSLLQENSKTFKEIKNQFELEKNNMENGIISKLSTTSNPVKLELENLKNKTIAMSNLIQATAKSQRQTQYSLQNFNATYKLRNFYLEKSLKRMTDQISELNITLNPDYGDSLDETIRDLDIDYAIAFVSEVRDIWPTVLHNISSIVQEHKNDIEFVEEGFQQVRIKFKDVIQNQSQCCNRIDSMQNQVKQIQENIAFMEQIQTKEALDKNNWAQYDFNHTFDRSGCFGGNKFVKRTGYEVGSFVGVVLCSEERYKIYLSDSLNGVFLNIGDTNQNGEDHCEFVGANKTTPVRLKAGVPQFGNIPGYRRGNWGEVPIKDRLSFFHPTPEWYECGVKIP